MWTRESLQELIEGRLAGYRFIVVANREPYVHRFDEDRIVCSKPASGMATAVNPIMMASGGVWVGHGSGDADHAVVDERDCVRVPPEDPRYTLRRVWLSKEEEKGFYFGSSNECLWPMCHVTFTRPRFVAEDWETYRRVNEKFAQAVLEEAGSEPSFVFIQDYHFCLLPRLLKNEGRKNLVVAQFWHVPWPNPEVFRVCPWKDEILDGLLGNDLLGFHLRYDCQNFFESVDRFAESRIDHERSEVVRGGAATRVSSFPISIDFEDSSRLAASPRVAEAMDGWRRRLNLGDRILGGGIERLDYTKGIVERLRGLDRFLSQHPEQAGRLQFVQIAVPSRTHLESYRRIEDEVDEAVEQINWRWRQGRWRPIVLLKEHHDSVQMAALHRLCRFFIVSSLHDGMNLVAKEFVASRDDEQGVLILSRFTGAIRELDDALPVNPFATHEIADAIALAIDMPSEEQRRRMHRMRETVARNNVYRWGGKILSTLLHFDLPDSP
ncbi:MAG: trehalose-6-phosphate synthase [Planctomyces sp.]|nr:trehalose-6-phosphate synthase [Planctomyces sp.]